jgi:hypothetical protein
MVSGNVIPPAARSALPLLNIRTMRSSVAWRPEADLFGKTNLL